jgi:hypothetical protein
MRSPVFASKQENIWMRQSLLSLANQVDWWAMMAFGLPFFIYLLTLAPTLYNLDSAELTTAAATGGLVRATGYPTYLILGRLWSWLPFGDVGFRLNLASAFYGAVAILCSEFILRRMQIKAWARFCAWGLLTIAPYFWAMSIIAEVYTLHLALMGITILTLLRWVEKPTPFRFFLPVMLTTVGLGNHAATVLLVPAYVWFVLVSHPRHLRRPRTLIAGMIGVLLGTVVFLYLPLAYLQNPAFNYAGQFDATGRFVPVDLTTLAGLRWLVTGQSFSGLMFGYQWPEIGPEIWKYAQQLWAAFFAIGIGPGLIGLVKSWQKDWRQGSLLSLVFLANAIFYINYRVVDKNTMFLPTYFIWAIWVGIGLQTILNWWQAQDDKGALGRNAYFSSIVAWAIQGIVIVAVLLALFWNWSRVSLADDMSTRQQSEEILALVEPEAIVFGWWETVPGIQYLQLVEGVRPDVLAINRFLISGDDMLALIESELDDRPIYINSPPLELIQTTEITKIGPLFQLHPR